MIIASKMKAAAGRAREGVRRRKSTKGSDGENEAEPASAPAAAEAPAASTPGDKISKMYAIHQVKALLRSKFGKRCAPGIASPRVSEA
tara:strand:- start:521 stop:784 length:264 start_codon:yes stop_codon:yes gene_type:complete